MNGVSPQDTMSTISTTMPQQGRHQLVYNGLRSVNWLVWYVHQH
uniref:Uncharacterized protein n=1 Tax=Arundo donax TaxID=35708 RepID=A0A0A9DMB8_ARUDO